MEDFMDSLTQTAEVVFFVSVIIAVLIIAMYIKIWNACDNIRKIKKLLEYDIASKEVHDENISPPVST